jgi:hypothetical protein
VKELSLKEGLEPDEAVEDFIRRGVRRAWLKGFESGVEAVSQVTTDSPITPSVMKYLAESLEELEEEDDES